MPNLEHIELVKLGAKVVAEWKSQNADVILDLSRAALGGCDLAGMNLSKANLTKAVLIEANLSGANLSEANLKDANLFVARLYGANLSAANLSETELSSADLTWADLTSARLDRANLSDANFSGAKLKGTDFTLARMRYTVLADVDLRNAKGLDYVEHASPSTIGIDSIVKSSGQIPELFLRGCGVPDVFIQYVRSLTTSPIQYYSCFISYSTKDQDFAERMHNDLQAKGVRCWFAPHDIQSGKKIHEQIDEAIRVYDKLLLILSPSSMSSEWVKTEIENARAREAQQKKQMLFPVRLVSFDEIKAWRLFDADIGRDSAREIREYYIPDFSCWKTDADAYAREFEKLLRDLKAETTK